MRKWVAERGTDSPDIWRDEDVAMATERHVLPDEDTARTMLVGMLASEGYGWYARNADRRDAFLKMSEDISECHTNRVELPWNQVYYQIRPL